MLPGDCNSRPVHCQTALLPHVQGANLLRMKPARTGLGYLLFAVATFAFSAVWFSIAFGWLDVTKDGPGTAGIRIAAIGVGGISLVAAFQMGWWALRGGPPMGRAERERVRQVWSTRDGSMTTVYEQARRKAIVNLLVASAASLLTIGFVVLGVAVGEAGMAFVAGVLGLVVVPFTVRGLIQFFFEPVVLELSRSGVHLRGHGFFAWGEVASLRVEGSGTPLAPGEVKAGSARRLGVVLSSDPGGFSFMSALSFGRFTRIGITEQELPVSLEEVVAQARAYHPVDVQEAAGMSAAADALKVPMPEGAEADPRGAAGQPALWQGAPVVSKILRRRVRATASSIGYQAGGLIFTAIGLTAVGQAAAIPFVILVFALFLVGSGVVRFALGTRRAVESASRRRYILTDGFLVTESGEQRHERRRSTLPPLILSLEGDGVGTITYELPGPSLPAWLQRFAPPNGDNILVESVSDAEGLFRLLGKRVNAPADGEGLPVGRPSSPVGAGSGIAAPRTANVRRLPLSAARIAASVPWLFGVPFLAMGSFSLYLGLVSGPAIVPVAFGAAMAGFGGWVVWSHARSRRRQHRLAEQGIRTMARVVGIADASLEVNDVRQWVVVYEYEAAGLTRSGEGPPMPRDDAMQWAAGDRVRVAYLADEPDLSMWLGGDPVDEG